jgi:hypothetical protein
MSGVAQSARRANHFALSELSQALSRKIFHFRFSENHDCIRASASTRRGRIAIVTDVGSGMRWTRPCRKTSDADADERNRVVLIPRRWDQPPGLAISALTGRTRREPGGTEANKPGTPRRARISRKPLRRECRCFGVPVAFFVACEPRVRLSIRCSLRPLNFRGPTTMHHSDNSCRGNAKPWLQSLFYQQMPARRSIQARPPG